METTAEFDLLVERLGINGEGVGYHEGFTVFVDEALPKEKVRVRLYEKRKNFGRAKIVEILTASPHRVKPVCPLFGRCGGCQLMHLDYAQQLIAKRQRVVDALERIGKFTDSDVQPCEPSSLPLGYRNKIQLPVVDGRLGLYARNSHDLVEIERCFIHCDLGEKALAHIQSILKAFSFELKAVLIKTAVNTQQVLVILVTVKEEMPAGLAETIMAAMPEIKGVVQNVHPTQGNVILSRDFRTLAGQGWVEEKLLGLTFKVSPASFFQVNPAQAERLYQKVLEFSSLGKDEIVLDAYCGVGTLSLILAREAKEVIGIECVPEAILDAEENAKHNGISNARFLCGQAEELVPTLKGIDVAILNPPRKGCEPSFLQKLVSLQPKRVVYVSCDPATLARDLRFLCDNGYVLDIAQPFDMFPQTAHVECIVRLKLC